MANNLSEVRLYTTSSGQQIPLRPIHVKTLDEISLRWAEVEKIAPPTYTVEVVGGGTEEIAHDPTTLQTDEDKQAWRDYQVELAEAIEQHNEDSVRVLVTFGVDMEPPDDEWEKSFEFCGISVPTEPAERKVFYFQRVVLTDPIDEQLLVRKIQLISRLSGEELERVDALFRRAVEGGGGVDTAEQAAGDAGQVAA